MYSQFFVTIDFVITVFIQVRVENVQEPSIHIPAVLAKVKSEYISKTYQIDSWSDPTDFMEQLAKRMGRLLKVV